jgi:hypothetical protein
MAYRTELNSAHHHAKDAILFFADVDDMFLPIAVIYIYNM